jgi:hypothetical protein
VSWYPFEEESWDDGDGDALEGEGAAPGAPEPFTPGAWELGDDDTAGGRWPLDARGLLPRERWQWYEQLWGDVCMLRERYRLALRAGWWEDELQVEALAALAAWIERYDSGEWDDPPGKLALLYDLERISLLLRDGLDPFYPERDRVVFLRFLIESGCQPPPQAPPVG